MKKALILIFCLFLFLSLTACDWFERNQTETTTTSTSEATTPASSESTASETTTTATASATSTEVTTSGTAETTTSDASEITTAATPETTMSTVETTTPETPETTTAASTDTSTTTAAGPRMYSSYALMKTYNELTGEAQFDYFDMLRGDEAVEWLVAYEGKTEAEAQAIVDDYADSEFIMKNINPLLRTIDLTDLPLKLMYFPDGTVVDGATPVDADINDLNTLYNSHPDLVLNSFFYFVEVSGGDVILVEQVYWP